MSEPNKIRKWVVEKFDGISPGLRTYSHDARQCVLEPFSPLAPLGRESAKGPASKFMKVSECVIGGASCCGW